MTTNRLLVCAPLLPEYDRESGSRRIFHLIQFACEMGWAVSFVAGSDKGGDRYRKLLQQMGVATYVGSGARTDDLIRAGRFDIAICAFWFHAETYMPRIRELSPGTRVIVDSIDLHFLRNIRKSLRPPGDTWASGTLNDDFASAMAREINTYSAADAVLTVSAKEAALLNDFIRGRPIAHVIPDSEDLAPSSIPYEQRRGIAFVGNFRHPPNREAAAFLCEEIIPRLDSTLLTRHPVSVIGNGLPAAVRSYGERLPNVQMVGWVPSIVPYLERARVSVIPLFNGAGTKRKLVQALMIGTPTVSTTIGVEGLDLSSGKHVLVADDPDAFASAVERLIDEPALWQRIAAEGRERIMDLHGAETVRGRFGEVLSEVLRRESRTRADDCVPRQALGSSPRQEYERVVVDIRKVVERTVPSDATVLVVSKGDEELLKLGARRAWHFPRNAQGVYAGFYPAGSDEAIAHLEDLRRSGAEYLVLPKPAFWWLEKYAGFNDYLERHYRLVIRDEETCIIFALTQATDADDRMLNRATSTASLEGAAPGVVGSARDAVGCAAEQARPSTGRPAGTLPAVELLLVWILCCAGTGAYAAYAGQDTNWDQRNYHVYSVYAWFNGRADMDVAPGQVQTWINPLPHVPQYWLIRHLPPVWAGIGMGALAGFNGLLLWALTRRLVRGSPAASRACAVLVTVMGLTGSMYVSYIGTTFAEYLCSPFILAALVVLVPADRAAGAWPTRSLLLSGLFLGFATGLKLTNVVFAIAMLVSLLALWPVMRLRWRSLFAFAAGGLAGFTAFGSVWALSLELAFGNPVFPFFNAVFQSPWFDVINFGDDRFPPHAFLHAAVTYPFVWFLGLTHPTSELPFREPRFALVAVILPLTIAASLRRLRVLRVPNRARRFIRGGVIETSDLEWGLRPRGAEGGGALMRSRSIELRLLSLFFVISYAIWLKQFGVQRYALPLELLAGGLILLGLDRMIGSLRTVAVAFAVIVLFAALWTRSPDWTRTSYGVSWFDIATTTSSPSGNLYVMLTQEPMSYAIPFMPRQDRFVRLAGNMPLEPQMYLGRRAAEIIRQYPGPIRTLSVGPLKEYDRERLRRFGLTEQNECRTFRSRLDTFQTCGLQRVSRERVSR